MRGLDADLLASLLSVLASVRGITISPFRLRRLMHRINAHLAATGADGLGPPEALHNHRPAA
ncbi:MAG: hypothetical protein LAO05_10670 [Acidobacteriia bacterium]|nr:hypothetical protein [Terriglobia bacterium]